MRRDVDVHDRKVILMDSISLLEAGDAGAIVVCASHGGDYAGEVALRHSPSWVSFNDAGVGKDAAGILALERLARQGVPACTVAHTSARIGDVDDHWENGVISYANALAVGLARPGDTLREVVERVAEAEGRK